MKRIRSNKRQRFNACDRLQGGIDMFGHNKPPAIDHGLDLTVRFAGVGVWAFCFDDVVAYYYDEDNCIGEIRVDDVVLSVEDLRYGKITNAVYGIVDQQIQAIEKELKEYAQLQREENDE